MDIASLAVILICTAIFVYAWAFFNWNRGWQEAAAHYRKQNQRLIKRIEELSN